MTRAHAAARLAVCSLTAIIAGAAAQTRDGNRDARETTTFRTEQELKLTIEVDAPPSAQCEASAVTSYHQRNTVARVEATISTATCPAAGGDFKLTVRVRGAGGEIRSMEFAEAWQSSDASQFVVTKDYPIGEDVELLTARVRGLTCRCAQAADAAPQ